MQKQIRRKCLRKEGRVLVVDESTEHDFTVTSTSKEMFFFFFRALTKKGIARHIDTSSVVWTLIEIGKLANQIARLAAIMVKKVNTTVVFIFTRKKRLKFVKRVLKKFHLNINVIPNLIIYKQKALHTTGECTEATKFCEP